MSGATVAVVIPTLGRPEAVVNLLSLLHKQEQQPDQVIVVDQNSKSHDYGNAVPHLIVVKMQPAGPAAARNAAAARARTDVLLFLDDDVEPDSAGLIAAHAAWYQHAFIAGVHGAVRQVGRDLPEKPDLPTVPTPLDWLTRSPNCAQLRVATGVPGGNLSIRKAIFDAQNGFDERFATGEDREFGFRLFRDGHIVIHDPSAAVVHRRLAVGGTRAELAPSFSAGIFRPEPSPGEAMMLIKHFPTATLDAWRRQRLGTIWSWNTHGGNLGIATIRTIRLMRSIRMAHRLLR